MRVLILGSTGMAGHTLSVYLKERGYDVTTYSSTPFPFCTHVIGNAFDEKQLKQILNSGGFDIVVNCIGILNQMAENNHSMSLYLNGYLPHLIADTLKVHRCKLIHVSTDCIFAGNTGPYDEKSMPDGKSFYSRTKAIGEIDDSKNLTFRTSIIGPDMRNDGIGLFNWFMKQHDRIDGYSGAIWTGVTTLTLAKAIEHSFNTGLVGLYHLVNNTSISKYDLLTLFNKYFRANSINIQRNDLYKSDKSLFCSRRDFNFIVPSYEEMINEMNEWINAHSHFYPHYKLDI